MDRRPAASCAKDHRRTWGQWLGYESEDTLYRVSRGGHGGLRVYSLPGARRGGASGPARDTDRRPPVFTCPKDRRADSSLTAFKRRRRGLRRGPPDLRRPFSAFVFAGRCSAGELGGQNESIKFATRHPASTGYDFAVDLVKVLEDKDLSSAVVSAVTPTP